MLSENVEEETKVKFLCFFPGMAQVNSATSVMPNRKLLVKVIKATNLGQAIGCRQPYCVIEMDSPSQKYQTSVINGTSSPFWDEHFLL